MSMYRVIAVVLLGSLGDLARAEGEAGGDGSPSAALFFVSKAGFSPNPDGLSWTTAFTTLQQGIDAAQAAGGGEVWVAGGRYGEARVPGGVLFLREGVAVYGGFGGTESARAERDWRAQRCIIDGFTANNGGAANPVVAGSDDAILDGFTIQGGRGLQGGGMLNNGASPRIENCIFTNNRVTEFGGAMRNMNGAAPLIINCIFYGNRGDIHAGAIYNESCSPSVVGCTISGNTAEFRGGGIYNKEASSPLITNCIVFGNTNEEIGNTGTSNPSINYSDIGVPTSGVGNISMNPLFRNASTGNFALRAGSPAIDHGRDTSQLAFFSVLNDYVAQPRGFDGDQLGFSAADGSDFDMGAMEYRGEAELRFHSADVNEDYAFSLSELLRVIQFYNAGGYQCVNGTEDGYAPGIGGLCTVTPTHDSDYAPQNYILSLSELLRAIQLYNSPGGYGPLESSEDGFVVVLNS